VQLGRSVLERVEVMWERWEGAQLPDDLHGVSVVTVGARSFVRAPAHLRDRIACDPPSDIHQLVEQVSDVLERVVGIADLWYADDETLQLAHPGPLQTVADNDPRLHALAGNADRFEWLEASADESCATRLGIVEHDELLAVATLHEWDHTVGHFGVFTRADARGRGLAPRTASAAIAIARSRGLVPQWRSRVSNTASAAVARRLGFEAIGRQMSVRVRNDS
jgi:RimJ/RimL family protein N-acetyltransferase